MTETAQALIAETNTRHRRAMCRLLAHEGFECVEVATVSGAVIALSEGAFEVALVARDLEHEGGGFEVLRAQHEVGARTPCIMLTDRREYEEAVRAYRLGARDVIVKEPKEVAHLKAVLGELPSPGALSGGELAAVSDALAVLDESFRIMLDMAHSVYKDVSQASVATFHPRILLVDDQQAFLTEIADMLGFTDWQVAVELAGGAALDKTSEYSFDVVAAREELQDLPGTMVVRTVQSTHPETLGVVYSSVGDGRVERHERGKCVDTEVPFADAKQVHEALDRAVNQVGMTQRERRLIKAFRSDHEAYLRRYAEVKLRLSKLLADE